MSQHYSEQFKEDVIKYCLENKDVKQSQVAREFGVKPNTLSNWLNRDRRLPSPEQTAQAKEISALKKRIRELEMENKVLKAAAAYFAKDAVPKVSTLL